MKLHFQELKESMESMLLLLNGKLLGFDQHMNLVLDDAREEKEGEEKRLGRVVVRGSNIISIALA